MHAFQSPFVFNLFFLFSRCWCYFLFFHPFSLSVSFFFFSFHRVLGKCGGSEEVAGVLTFWFGIEAGLVLHASLNLGFVVGQIRGLSGRQ